jgi:hypothetical protein
MQFTYVGTICIGFRDDRGFLNLIYCFPVHFIFVTFNPKRMGENDPIHLCQSVRNPHRNLIIANINLHDRPRRLGKSPAFMVLVQLYCCTQFH